MPYFGLPEFAYGLVVGVIVGGLAGFVLRPEKQKLPAMLMTQAVWCSLLGAIGLLLMIPVFSDDSCDPISGEILLLLMYAAGGISLFIGTPFSVATTFCIFRFRARGQKQTKPKPEHRTPDPKPHAPTWRSHSDRL